jgi:hypothetical protein
MRMEHTIYVQWIILFSKWDIPVVVYMISICAQHQQLYIQTTSKTSPKLALYMSQNM